MIPENTLVNGRYRVIRSLSLYQTGGVYEAIDQSVDCTVALKELQVDRDEIRHASWREANLLANVRHPALPRVTDSFSEGNVQFIVMEFIEGKDLQRLLLEGNGPFPVELVLEWAEQLLDALNCLHSRQPPILHNDIKPLNLKLTPGGQIVLLGFTPIPGTHLSLSDKGTISGYIPAYASLEQIQGRDTSALSDVYSMGMTLYHLLTGLTPPDAFTRLLATTAGDPDPLRPANEVNSQISPAIATVLAQSTSIKRDGRPPSAAAMRQALRQASAPDQKALVDLQNEDNDESNFAEGAHRVARPENGAVTGENQSTRLRYAIENKYPYPIARPFYELRLIDDWKAQIPQLANILGSALEHVAIVALAEYLSGNSRSAELNRRLVETLRKPISHGTWAGILRETLTFLSDNPVQLFTGELPALYFGKEKGQSSTSLRAIGDELVAMRNVLIKQSSEAPPAHADYLRFKRRLIELLQMLTFVKDYPLIAVKDTKMESGIKTHHCSLLSGFHEAFAQVDLECDLDLQQMRVAMLNPSTHELLYLYPFYLLRECPETGCRSTHLFRFDRMERNRAEYIAAAGHRLSDQAAGSQLQALLQSAWSVQPSLRQQARYLFLEFAESWQQRVAGERVATYEIEQHLRRGGMADVYRVKAANSEERRALKLLPFQFLSDQKMIQRFRQEAMQARALEHPNITRVFDYGEDLVDHYLVMEMADGWRTAEGRIALDVGELPKPFTEKMAIAVIKQACEGLDYIHRQQIIHRDIKPGNLLLFKDERVKLADFGIARSRESITLTMTGLAMGTPEYMSPEQAEGKKDLSFASDIYSLGVVMYELIAGQPPFRRSTPLATAVAHLRDRVPPLTESHPQVSEALQRIVLKCLEKEPKDRYDSVRGLYQDLDLYERGEATTQSAAKRPLVRYVEKLLSGHEGSVNTLAFAPDGLLLASGGKDRTIRLWDIQSATLRQTSGVQDGEVTALAFSPDGERLISGSIDKTTRLWDARTLAPLQTQTWEPNPTVDAIAICADGRWGASGGELREPIRGTSEKSRSGEICLWDAQSWTLKSILTGHAFTVTSLAFSPDSATLASASWDQTIRLWDVSSGDLKITLSGHQGAVHAVSYSPDGETLASVSEDQTVKLWNAKTGEIKQTLAGHSSRALAVAFSPDGETIASGGGEHQQWGEVKLWDARSGKLKQTLRVNKGAVLSLAFSPSGDTLASGSSHGRIALWPLRPASFSQTKNVLWVCDSPNYSTAAFGLRKRGMMVLVASSTDEAMSVLLAGHGSRTVDLVVSELGRSEDKPDSVAADLLFISEARQAGIDLPIYVFGAEGGSETFAAEILAAGGNGYVDFNSMLDKFAGPPAPTGSVVTEGSENKDHDSPLTKDERRVKRLVADLMNSSDPDERVEAAERLSGARAEAHLAVPALIAALGDNENTVRRSAADVLGRIGPVAKDAVPLLVQLLKDRDENIRSSAAFSLMIIDREATAALAIPILIEAVKHSDENVQSSARYVLRNVGPEVKGAVPVLVQLLNHPERYVRKNAIVVLRKIGPGASDSVPGLISLLRDQDASIRWGAVVALQQIGPRANAAVPALRQLLQDEDQHVRAAAGEAIPKLITTIEPNQ